MVGLGTLINMAAIAAGGTAGLVFRRYLSKSLQTNLMSVMGLVCMFLGTAGTLSLMLRVSGTGPALTSTGAMMMVISFTVGTLIGTILKLEDRFEGFGLWLQRKAGRTGDNGFVGAFVTASLTVCIGAMAVIGAIQDGIAGDYTVLAAKAVLDCVIILIMTSALGVGCIFSAIPVGIFQGLVTLLAFLIGPLLSQASIDAIGLTGSMMIFAVGVRNVVENQVDFAKSRNVIIAALILVLAIGITYSGSIQIGVVSLSGLAVSSIVGILLNAILPGNDYQFDKVDTETAENPMNMQV